jgi:hypothetical protein
MKFKVVARQTIEWEFIWDAESLSAAKKAIARMVRRETEQNDCDLRDYAREGNVVRDTMTAKVIG